MLLDVPYRFTIVLSFEKFQLLPTDKEPKKLQVCFAKEPYKSDNILEKTDTEPLTNDGKKSLKIQPTPRFAIQAITTQQTKSQFGNFENFSEISEKSAL